MPRAIGIDLGTTNSVMVDSDDPLLAVILNGEAEKYTRSIVSLRRAEQSTKNVDEILVGRAAYENWIINPAETVISVKRLMGRSFGDKNVQYFRDKKVAYSIRQPARGTSDSLVVVLGGAEYTPSQISSIILSKLKRDAERRLIAPVTHAVITVPAYFTEVQVAATRAAARMSSIGVMRIVREPVAAAMAFDLPTDKTATVLVYDLGGGTFDVAILIKTVGGYSTFNTGGDMWLGGDDIDELIVDQAVTHMEHQYSVNVRSNAGLLVSLRNAARQLKEDLSNRDYAVLNVPGILSHEGRLISANMSFTREEFEQLARPILGRYRLCVCGIANAPAAAACATCGLDLSDVIVSDGKAMRIVNDTMQEKSYTVEKIDYVIMAGNATKTPLVYETLCEVFGTDKVLRSDSPKDLVAQGAALLAYMLPFTWQCECGHTNDTDESVCGECGKLLGGGLDTDPTGQISSHNFGTESAGDRFDLFVRKGDPYPTEHRLTQTFYTQLTGQRMLVVPVYMGFDLEAASRNEKQGELFVILPPELRKNTPVHVSLWLDYNGEAQISIKLDGDRDLKAWMLRGLCDADVVDKITSAERIIQAKNDTIDTMTRQVLDNQLRGILALMEMRSFDLAYDRASVYLEAVQSGANVKKESTNNKARRLLGFTRELREDFGWALTDAKKQRLAGLVKQISDGLGQMEEREMAEIVAVLDAETDRLPDEVDLIRKIEFRINRRIKLRDRKKAQYFLDKLNSIVIDWKERGEAPADKLKDLKREIDALLATFVPVPEPCDIDGLYPLTVGDRYCPNGHDLWLPKRVATQ